jgi:hypothetical protein
MIKPPDISPIDGLVDLACRDGVDVRPTLLRVLTDLYVQKPVHSADETTQYVELALGLIDTVDETTRAAVAASLSHYPSAPPAVLAKLGLTSGAPAAGDTLPEIAFVPENLVAEPVSETALDLPRNISAATIATDSLTDVFLGAPPGDRRLILATIDVVADPAALIAPASNDIVMRLEEAALRRDPLAFASLLERALGIGRELAHRITEDASGEPVVIVARALGIRAAVLQRILLFLNPAIGHSVERVFDLAVLYDEISLSTASHMVTLWRQDAPAVRTPKPRHEPVYQEDARTVRRPVARETRRADKSDRAAPGKAAR